jgi:hypothetical protein
MNKHGQQWANAFMSSDNSTSNTSRWQQTDACFLLVDNNESQDFQSHFQSMDADGFTTYFSTAVAAANNVVSLCLDGISSKLGAWTKTPTTGALTETINSRQGFAPKSVLVSAFGYLPNGSPMTDALWSLGMSDLTNERSVALVDRDGQNPTQADSYWSNNKLITNPSGGPSMATEADLTSTTNNSFTVNYTTNTIADRLEHLYLLTGAAGTDTFPQTAVLPADQAPATATAYSNQKHACTLSNGTDILVSITNSGGGYGEFYYRPNGGTWSWYGASAEIAGWSNGSIASYVDSGGTERLVAIWKQSGTGGGRTNDASYVCVGTFNADRSALTWGTASSNGIGDSRYNYSDIVVIAEGTGAMAHLVLSFTTGTTTNQTYHAQFAIDSSGGIPNVIGSGVAHTVQSANYGLGAHTYPSIDFDPVTKRLFTTWSAGTTGAGKGIRFRTASYSAGSWTWASEVEVDNAIYASNTAFGFAIRWDGVNGVIAGDLYDGTYSRWFVYDVSTTGSVTQTYKSSTASGATAVNLGSVVGFGMAIDPTTRDVYLIGNGIGVTDLAYYRYQRSNSTMSDRTVVDQGVTSYPYANAWYSNNKIHWIYTSGNNSPYAVKYDRIQLS